MCCTVGNFGIAGDENSRMIFIGFSSGVGYNQVKKIIGGTGTHTTQNPDCFLTLSHNYFLDSLSLDPDKADKKASKKKSLFFFVINKMDAINNDKEKAKKFLENFQMVIEDYRMTFPFAAFAEAQISVHKSPYEDIDSIFEKCKQALY